jgi:hypothetical protein
MSELSPESRSWQPLLCHPREEHARMLKVAAARRLRAFERHSLQREEDAASWKQIAPLALNKAAALRRESEFPLLP